MPLRAAAICGLAAPVSFVAGVVLADVVQPAAFSPVNDDISDLGALTATSPWLYNQVAANLTGILVLGFALGLWAALGSGLLSRAGVLGLVVVGTGLFLDGLFRFGLPGDRCRLRQHLLARLGAQDRVGCDGRGSSPDTVGARLRVQAPSSLAPPVAPDAPRNSCCDCDERRVQRLRTRRCQPCRKRSLVPVARVRLPPPPARLGRHSIRGCACGGRPANRSREPDATALAGWPERRGVSAARVNLGQGRVALDGGFRGDSRAYDLRLATAES